MASRPIYQFYSELGEYEPKIWRRFQVFGDITMARLGYIVMTMYEMQANHTFHMVVPMQKNFEREMEFNRISDKTMILPEQVRMFGVNDVENLFPGETPTEWRLSDAAEHSVRSVLGTSLGDRLSLEYGSGDCWQVNLILEDIIEDKELPGRELPRVLEGEGYGIIENCGGPAGLKQIAESFQKRAALNTEVAGSGRDDLDLSVFDLADINFRLKKVPRIYRDLYEFGFGPTKRSVDLLERKYMKGNG